MVRLLKTSKQMVAIYQSTHWEAPLTKVKRYAWSDLSHVAGRCLWGWSGRTAAGTAGRRTPPAHRGTPGRSCPLSEDQGELEGWKKGEWQIKRREASACSPCPDTLGSLHSRMEAWFCRLIFTLPLCARLSMTIWYRTRTSVNKPALEEGEFLHLFCLILKHNWRIQSCDQLGHSDTCALLWLQALI